jgi:hypothetical protein
MQAQSAKRKPLPANYKRVRAHFRAYLIYRLQQHGAPLPDRPSYQQLIEALDAVLPDPRVLR